MFWALVIYAATGAFAESDSVALTSVSGLQTQQICEQYGRKAESMASGTKKNIKFICVPVVK
jgi:hypothetical protein